MIGRETKLGAVDAALACGIADAEAGRVMLVAEAFAYIHAQLACDEDIGSAPSSNSERIRDHDAKDLRSTT